MKFTKDQQIEALKMLTPEWAIQRKAGVAGGKPWTAHEYVTHMLDSIFEPSNWDFEITGELRTVELPGGELLLSIPGKLTVRFADGTVAIRADVGTGAVHRLRDEADLSKTPVENFETGMKDAVTSALKGCARDLGRIFVPMQSDLVANLIRRNVFEAELGNLLPPPDDLQDRLERNKAALGRDEGDLTGSATTAKVPAVTVPEPSTAAQAPAIAPPKPKPLVEALAAEDPKPSTLAKPAPPGNGKGIRKSATIQTSKWSTAARQLAARQPHYQDANGQPNFYHMAGVAFKLHYTEITDGNLEHVLRDLEQHALEQQTEAGA